MKEKDLKKESAHKAVDSEKKEVITIAKKEYEQLTQQLSEYKDKYVRLCAEFDNARKRMERDKVEFIKYANEGLLKEFLDILDNLERSVEAAKTKHEDYAAFLKGVEIVMAHIYEMLRKHNVKPIEAMGEKFDPHLHEPLMQEPSDAEEGTVLEEYQKGYKYGDRVLRTSKVKVATSKGKEDKSSETSGEISSLNEKEKEEKNNNNI